MFESSNHRKSGYSEGSEVRKKIFSISCTILAAIFIAAGVVQALNESNDYFLFYTPNEE